MATAITSRVTIPNDDPLRENLIQLNSVSTASDLVLYGSNNL